MDLKELRSMTADQLKSNLVDLKKEAFNLRFQKVSGELEKTGRIRIVRRTIARIMTLLKEGQLKKGTNHA